MSAFFISINRDGAPFEPAFAHNMMKAIEHYGGDDRQLILQDNFAIGYQSFWTVPEEQGERQPLFDEESQTWLVFYGRIDNRRDLVNQLSLSLAESLSDAAILHQYLIQFGETRLAQVIGPFVFVLFHPASSHVLCARDGMGGRNLAYKIDKSQIHIASNEMALVGHPSIKYEFNRERMGRVIAQMMQDKVAAVIRGLDILEPGNLLDISSDELSNRVFWRCDGSSRISLENDQAYANEFRRLLDQAVRRRSRSIGAIGTMLSGGMDSVPISILLAKQLADSDHKLTALSWVYNRYPDADERNYSMPVCDDFGIDQVCIDCDDVWPRFDESTYVQPLSPFSTPYSEYQQALMAECRSRNIRTLMTGIHGDLLYGHTNSILIELLKAWRWRDFFNELKQYWSSPENRSYVVKHLFIAQLPGMKSLLNWRRSKQPLCAEFLQDDINSSLKNQTPELFSESLNSMRPNTYRNVFSGFAGDDQAAGRHMEAKFQLERRYPFRDRDLCEFLMAVPSDQLYFNRIPRPIVRNAFKSEFRSELSSRVEKTNFTSAISDGIESDQNWRVWFNSSNAKWSEYVKQCYFDDQNAKNSDIAVVQWRCGYYDYWKSVCYNRIAKELGLIEDNEKK